MRKIMSANEKNHEFLRNWSVIQVEHFFLNVLYCAELLFLSIFHGTIEP